ncbi:tRNA (adenosine(37)-N6)-threonylcarbamoyltransferase complex ATPase subunit type 1 TsaE [Halobacillus andaensis]|uniref:tRNA threonylcarbamoyladenosine biosynthesis protein TsaE n=1 Tax=Halobacillus andaensis TaxID=1176239 RepID=A0A917B6W4_HALAA|nr:tRNA (adenosine(37)-N6)-threonylcarbamoyltransferase complex ATPase subunit type 1 TsaE [Halobacillus andaensis]MBP2006570.1 tRNA threonylcarbamoyladenosine biosynthesis protein TsaE [Halobacillus andaensis]GGF28382.1 tRNA (adenosine(37)-N6)-threonylcarbamoyltransferase complex ATPase subunit type 1 TsaE [Halobacillus andaensis]
MTTMTWMTHSEEDTKQFGEKLGGLLQAGDVLTLEGDLGAGKTTFTKGLAKGLGVKRTVNSPTFTIIKEYMGRLPFYHMDVYRLEDSDEDLGFEEFFNGEGVTVVEWSQFIEDYLPEERLELTIEYVDETSRKISVAARSPHFEQVCKEMSS